MADKPRRMPKDFKVNVVSNRIISRFNAKRRCFKLKSGQNPLVLITDQLIGRFCKVLNNMYLQENEGPKMAPQGGGGGGWRGAFCGVGSSLRASRAGIGTVSIKMSGAVEV